MSGTVDLSGVVGSILRSYQAVLTEYQRMVTGDPGSLTTAARRYTEHATQVGEVGQELTQRAAGLGATWQGNAYDAFHRATGRHTGELDSLGTVLRKQSESLHGAANALTSARSYMDTLVQWFEQNARMLVQQAANAAAGAVGAFLNAARQLGESAVAAGRTSVQRLGEALSALFASPSGDMHILTQRGGVP
jgi:WXG100 family type VII secretion target